MCGKHIQRNVSILKFYISTNHKQERLWVIKIIYSSFPTGYFLKYIFSAIYSLAIERYLPNAKVLMKEFLKRNGRLYSSWKVIAFILMQDF